MLSNVRIYLYLGIFVIWTVVVGAMVAKFKEASFAKERFAQQQAITQILHDNDALALKLSTEYQDQLEAYKTKQEALTKDLKNELAKAPVYSTCRTTDGVRDVYKRKLKAQR